MPPMISAATRRRRSARRQGRLGGAVVRVRAVGLEAHQPDERRRVPPAGELVLRVPEPPDLVERQVDAAPLGVRAEVAHDVRQLERDAQVDRVVPGPGVRVAEDLDAGQTDRPRHPVAVLVQLLERGVAPLVDVHLDAVEDRLEVLALDGKGPDHLGEMLGDRLRRAAVVRAAELEPPLRQDAALLARGRRPLVDGVVDRPAEGIERVDRVPLPLRQEQERVVEVRPAATGEDGGEVSRVHDVI